VKKGVIYHMSKRIDLTGQRFGKLVVVGYSHTENKHAYWLCKCDCGNITTKDSVRLRNHRVLSCGFKCGLKTTIIFKENFINNYCEGYLLKNIKNIKKIEESFDLSIFEDEEFEICFEDIEQKKLNELAYLKKPDFIFDIELLPEIQKYNWIKVGKYKIHTSINRKTITLQKFIIAIKLNMKFEDIPNITFKTDNRSDFRLENLLFNDKNYISQKFIGGKSKTNYKGVLKEGNKFITKISKNKKNFYLGSFNTPEEAAEAYNKKAIELFGKFAYQNKIKKPKKTKLKSPLD